METNTTYHSDTRHISKSMLTTFGESRREFHRQYILGIRKPPTVEMQMGTLVHLAVLQPDKLEGSYVIAPDKFMTKAGGLSEAKDAVAWIEENANGKIVLSSKQMDRVACMANVAKEALGELVEQATYIETPYYWESEGHKLRCLPDMELVYEDVEVIDLKTARDASVRGFEAAAREREYALQHVHYLDGMARKYPGRKLRFSFLVVENGTKDSHYRIAWHEIKRESDIVKATAVRNWRLNKIRNCYLSGDWKESWELRGKINEGAQPTGIGSQVYHERNNYEGDEN